MRVREQHLKHGVGEKRFQHPPLTRSVRFILLQEFVKVPVLLTVGQNLKTVLVVPHKLLIDVKHWQQDIKEIR